jgi:hypothetical protein
VPPHLYVRARNSRATRVLRVLVRRLLAIAGVAVAAAAWLPAGAAAQGHQVVWAVGDAQAKDLQKQASVASMIQAGGLQRLLFLGDLTEDGTAAEYANAYGPTYGQMKSLTSPTIGNHDYPRRAQGYDPYWGPAVRQPGGGHWYSFDLGGWHFVSLSSMEDHGTDSEQLAWLRNDLARYSGSCTIAFTHYPRYSAGPQWNNSSLEPFWAALRGHAVLFLSGHAHNYQRLNPVRGITQFVVGTGGGDFGHPDYWDPRLASKADRYNGALRLELATGGARFGFASTDGVTRDSGQFNCVPHSPAPASIRTQRPANHARYGSLPTLYGRARNASRVRLTLVRRVGARTTKRTFPIKKLKPPPFPGAGAYSWKLKLPSATTLVPGGYRLDMSVRSLDRSLARKSTRFTIRR